MFATPLFLEWKLPTGNKATTSGNTIWASISKYKLPVIEPKESYHLNHAIQDYNNKISQAIQQRTSQPNSLPNGAIFFAVCRGKVLRNHIKNNSTFYRSVKDLTLLMQMAEL